MNTVKNFTDILNNNYLDFREKYHIKKIGIFGSYVRGKATENSDLDILVEFDPEFSF